MYFLILELKDSFKVDMNGMITIHNNISLDGMKVRETPQCQLTKQEVSTDETGSMLTQTPVSGDHRFRTGKEEQKKKK
jgi:hypothetical protein